MRAISLLMGHAVTIPATLLATELRARFLLDLRRSRLGLERGLLLLLELNRNCLGSLPIVLRHPLVALEELDEAEPVVLDELAHGQLMPEALLQQF